MPVAKLVLASFAPHKLGIGFATSHMRLTSFRIVREEVVETSVVLKTAKALPTNVDDPSFSEGRFASGTLKPRLQGSLLPVDEAELCSVCSHLMYRMAASPKAKVQMYLTITAGRYFCFSPSTFGFPQFSIRRQTRQTTSQVHTLRCLRQSRF